MKLFLLVFAISFTPLQSAPAGKGSISGIVIQSGTDRPIDGVQIFITPITTTPGTPGPLQQNQTGTFTDQSGRFELGNLAPGRYRIQWTRPGYFTPPVGTAEPQESIIKSLIVQLGTEDLSIASPPAATSVTVDIAPDERLGGFVFTLIPGGVISGRVLDSAGNPMVSVPLTALSLNYEDGHLVLRPGSNGTTSDDRGNYRLFGLRPGRYYVRVDSPRSSADSNEIVRAYFPGVSGVTAAVPIVVDESGESPGANFSMPSSGIVKISGNVVGPGNMSRANAQFYLLPAGTGSLEDPVTIFIRNFLSNPSDRADGGFELRGISEGHYDLCAVINDNGQMRSYTGCVLLDVGRQDLQNVRIEMEPAGDVKGRLVLEDASAIRRPLTLRLRDRRATLAGMGTPFNPNDDGTFIIPQLPRTRYSITNDTADTCLADISQGGKSVYDDGFIGGMDAEPIEVVLSNQCGTVQVQVVDDKNKAVSHAFVSLVPAMEHRRNPELYKRSIFDVAASKYPPIKRIPPGEYKLFAWDNIPPNAELNEQFLSKYEDRGVRVTVRHGDSLTIQVPLISTGN
jgi:hypothetical protein